MRDFKAWGLSRLRVVFSEMLVKLYARAQTAILAWRIIQKNIKNKRPCNMNTHTLMRAAEIARNFLNSETPRVFASSLPSSLSGYTSPLTLIWDTHCCGTISVLVHFHYTAASIRGIVSAQMCRRSMCARASPQHVEALHTREEPDSTLQHTIYLHRKSARSAIFNIFAEIYSRV